MVGSEATKAGSGLDHVDVGRKFLWNGVLGGAKAAHILALLAHVPLELGIEELVRLAGSGLEVDPIGIFLDVLDSGLLEPCEHRVNGLLAGKQHPLHLLVSLEVLAVLGVALAMVSKPASLNCAVDLTWRGHVHNGLFEALLVALCQGNL
jgi:hypothetical protein